MENWHYPRTELAQDYLNRFALGFSSHLAFIAPRWKGKTQFLLNDLAPLAHKQGYIPVYVNFSQYANTPHQDLINALEETIESLGKRGAFPRLMKRHAMEARLANELLNPRTGALDTPVKPASRELTYIDRLVSSLQGKARSKTVLLIIDEIQHLATSSDFDPLAYALRTTLDKRQGSVKSIFTGSSAYHANRLLNDSRSPFYNFVSDVRFPDLGAPYVQFLRNKLEDEYGISVSAQPLQKAFLEMNRSPYGMMKMMSHMIMDRRLINEARNYVLQLMEVSENFKGHAQRMKPVDRLVFLALCDGANLFSKEFMNRVTRETSVKGIPSNIQRSVQRLLKAGLINRSGGVYNIEKPGMRPYLESQANT